MNLKCWKDFLSEKAFRMDRQKLNIGLVRDIFEVLEDLIARLVGGCKQLTVVIS